jgi:hypothetical protein
VPTSAYKSADANWLCCATNLALHGVLASGRRGAPRPTPRPALRGLTSCWRGERESHYPGAWLRRRPLARRHATANLPQTDPECPVPYGLARRLLGRLPRDARAPRGLRVCPRRPSAHALLEALTRYARSAAPLRPARSAWTRRDIVPQPRRASPARHRDGPPDRLVGALGAMRRCHIRALVRAAAHRLGRPTPIFSVSPRAQPRSRWPADEAGAMARPVPAAGSSTRYLLVWDSAWGSAPHRRFRTARRRRVLESARTRRAIGLSTSWAPTPARRLSWDSLAYAAGLGRSCAVHA